MSATIIRPKYFLTPDDRRGILVVNGATAFSFVWTAFLTRLFQRVRLREWKPDDWLLAAAMVPWLQTHTLNLVPNMAPDIGHGTFGSCLPSHRLGLGHLSR